MKLAACTGVPRSGFAERSLPRWAVNWRSALTEIGLPLSGGSPMEQPIRYAGGRTGLRLRLNRSRRSLEARGFGGRRNACVKEIRILYMNCIFVHFFFYSTLRPFRLQLLNNAGFGFIKRNLFARIELDNQESAGDTNGLAHFTRLHFCYCRFDVGGDLQFRIVNRYSTQIATFGRALMLGIRAGDGREISPAFSFFQYR